jgi:hypothetical protein
MIRFFTVARPWAFAWGGVGVVSPVDAPGLLLLSRFNLSLILEFSFSQGYLPCSEVF